MESHTDRCKVYKDHLKSNCIDAFKQQFKQDMLNEVKLCLNALEDDVVNEKQTITLSNLSNS